MRTLHGLVGRRLATDAVKAGKGCSGSPNLSRDRGWTWYSRLAVLCEGSERVNPPSCDGAMVSGPVRKNRYSSPIEILPVRVLARSLSVGTFFTLNAMRSWR